MFSCRSYKNSCIRVTSWCVCHLLEFLFLGLVRVRQSLKTLQPVDELKKGPFTLQVRVQGYELTDAGVEVDICLAAASRSGSPVWESVLTLRSSHRLHEASRRLLKHGDQAEWGDGGFCSESWCRSG